MSEIKLRPCPMCGKDVAEITNAHNLENCANFESEDCPCEHYEDTGECAYYSVVCDFTKGGCGCTGGFRITLEEAVKAWNRRIYEQNEEP